MAEERRTIAELAVKYELEPDLRDVYVEGAFDAKVLTWLFRVAGCPQAAVYEIDTVDLPAGRLAARGLDGGQKGRVVAACLDLAEALGDGPQATGVVDRDRDALVGVAYSCPLLLVTDYACMEMYLLEPESLAKLWHAVAADRGPLPSDQIGAVFEVVRQAFACRAANDTCGLGLTWLRLDKQVEFAGQVPGLDLDQFAHKYLNTSGKLAEKPAFMVAVDRHLDAVRGQDPRHAMNGHDLLAVLGKWLARATRTRELAEPAVVEGLLLSCADFGVLAGQPLFQSLLGRVAA